MRSSFGNANLRNWPQWVRIVPIGLAVGGISFWSDAVHRAIVRSFFWLGFSILARSCEAMILAFKGAEYAAD
jgi:hypothetical protein